MGGWSLWWHVVNFGMPALAVALVLTTAALGVPWRARGARHWIRIWLLLSALGTAVLLAGLWWFGRDGKLLTYGVLVLAMGSAAWVVSRRH